MNLILKNLSLKIEGESHSKNITLKTKGFKENTKVSFDLINLDLKRRNPKLFFNTQRDEKDNYEILKGINKKGVINKDEIEVLFPNDKVDKKPYLENEGFLRPGQSDYISYLKNKTAKTGGGEFSGRMTLPIVFVGSIAKQILKQRSVEIYSRIKSAHNLEDEPLDLNKIKTLDPTFPTQTDTFKQKLFKALEDVTKEKDSIGGIVEIVVFNTKPGLKDVFSSSLEGVLSNNLFSIPAVKGVEFGDGFDITTKLGSEVLDSFYLDEESIKTKENHNGGINAGIANGMPIIIKVAIKPTPTIGKPVTSLNIESLKEETVEFKGYHDHFIVNRAIPALESAVALTILDCYYKLENHEKTN